MTNAFSGNRFSTITDIETKEWKTLFEEIKSFSDAYLKSLREKGAWPANYYWPQDSLMTNTRVWEYPYVMDMLNKYAPKGKVLDIGSALTFLPYYLAHKGYQVQSLDYDQQMIDWSEAIKTKLEDDINPGFDYKPLHSYAQGDVTDLQFEDNSFDVVTNVSVLEHLPFDMIMKSADSIYRVLKPGGIFICTLDCLVSGDGHEEHMPLDDKQFKKFLGILTDKFDLVEENVSSSPEALITNKRKVGETEDKGPKTLRQRLGIARRLAFNGNYSIEDNSLEWTAYGFTLKKA